MLFTSDPGGPLGGGYVPLSMSHRESTIRGHPIGPGVSPPGPGPLAVSAGLAVPCHVRVGARPGGGHATLMMLPGAVLSASHAGQFQGSSPWAQGLGTPVILELGLGHSVLPVSPRISPASYPRAGPLHLKEHD